MKKIIILATFLSIAVAANASVGVVVGSNKIANDGMPDIGPNEQAKVFICHAKYGFSEGGVRGLNGVQAENCAMAKCLKYYKMPANTSDEKAKTHCIRDGWSEQKGWNVIVVGPKGNNNRIISKSIGNNSKEDAWKFVRSDNFPVDKGTTLYEFYDDNTNGKD